MPEPRGEVAAAVARGRLVVVGGLRGLTTTSGAVSIYDIRRDRWRSAPPVRGVHHAAAAAIGRDVYVSGGARSVTDWTPTDQVLRIRPDGRATRVTPMPEGRQGHAMVALRGRLYVVGGVGTSDRTLIYNSRTRQWSTGAALPDGRDHLRAVVWEDRIWALGGRSGDPSRRVDIYDPQRDAWTRGPALPEPMSAMAVGWLEGALHVVGGEDPDLTGGVSNKHFALRSATGRWRSAQRPVLPVHGGGFGVVSNRLYIAGGASRQGALSTISWTGVTQSFTR